MDNIYDLFSKYYRELIYSSGHFDRERKVIIQIVKRFAGSHDCQILDTACGTGDALFELSKQGYLHLSGLDASSKMLERAKELLPECDFYHMQWERLSEVQELKGKFDLIFLISISLPHAKIENTPNIFRSFYNMLHPNGVLIFDNRMWSVDENNFLVEKDRPVEIFNNPRKVSIDNRIFIIEDKCNYIGDRQEITYRIREEGSNDEILIPVDYARVTTTEYLKLLPEAGFKKYDSFLLAEWPYELIYAIK